MIYLPRFGDEENHSLTQLSLNEKLRSTKKRNQRGKGFYGEGKFSSSYGHQRERVVDWQSPGLNLLYFDRFLLAKGT